MQLSFLLCYTCPVTSLLPEPLLGDLIARARERWIHEMARRLEERGFRDYRRSDAFALRFLASGPLPFGHLTDGLGVSRQLARKVVGALVERGLATVRADSQDARRRVVELSDVGREYATAVIEVVREINRDVANKVDPHDLAATSTVLKYIIDTLGL